MKNIERIVRQINQIYYMIYTGTILSTIIGYYLTMDLSLIHISEPTRPY
jgi:hypothetical protein